MKNIRNYNDKGQPHGYQELYINGYLTYKGFYNNDIEVDYEEFYWYRSKLADKTFYI